MKLYYTYSSQSKVFLYSIYISKYEVMYRDGQKAECKLFHHFCKRAACIFIVVVTSIKQAGYGPHSLLM
jgi:hypothetical protein